MKFVLKIIARSNNNSYICSMDMPNVIKVIYTDHAKTRIKERDIDKSKLPKKLNLEKLNIIEIPLELTAKSKIKIIVRDIIIVFKIHNHKARVVTLWPDEPKKKVRLKHYNKKPTS